MRNKIAPVFFIFAMALAALLLNSCSSRQVIYISDSGDMVCRIDLRLTGMFSRYIDDLSEAAGTGNSPSAYFDVERIKSSFEKLEGITLETVSVPSKDNLRITFRVKKDAAGIRTGAAGGIFTFSESGGVKKIRFTLDKQSYSKINSAFAFDDNPVTAGLTPQPDNPYTEDEYLDLVDYVFGEYSPEAAAVLERSFIDVEINTKREVLKAQGGKISGSKAVFSVPVVKFLTLHEPVVLEIEYR